VPRPLALLLAGAALAAAAPSAYARPIIAVQDDRLTTWSAERAPARAALIASTGVRWTRVDVHWPEIAPRRPRAPRDPADPAYRWERLDGVMRALQARGIRVLVSIHRSPRWANGGRSPQYAPNPHHYAAFVAAVGRRYSGRYVADGRRLPRIGHFEIWNEPNIAMFLRPQWTREPARGGRPARWTPASPRLYARMLRLATASLRAVRPDALVIAGALAPTATTRANVSVGVEDFIRGMHPYRPPVRAASQHIYPGAPPGRSRALPSEHGVPRIRALWRSLAGRAVPLYITETGYTSAHTPYRDYRVTRRQQAAYLAPLLRGLAQPGVRMVVWYNLQDHDLWPAGLLDERGRRKPSWAAFRRAVR